MMYNTYYCKGNLEHIQKTDQVHGQYAIDLGQITFPIANMPWSEDSPDPAKQSWARRNGLYIPI